jgi:hypothetical protein
MQEKCFKFVLSDGLSGDLLEQKVVQVPCYVTEDDLDTLADLFEEDMGRFFDEEVLELAQIWTLEIKNRKADYEAKQDEDGAWDLRPLCRK